MAADELGEWAKDLCLACGSEVGTAYRVGAWLAENVLKSWEGRDD